MGTWEYERSDLQGPSRLEFRKDDGFLTVEVKSTNRDGEWDTRWHEAGAIIERDVATFNYNGPVELHRGARRLEGIQLVQNRYEVKWKLQASNDNGAPQ